MVSLLAMNKLDISAACVNKPPLLFRKSNTKRCIPFCDNSDIADFTSYNEVAEKRVSQIYPVWSSIIMAVRTLYKGILSRIIVTSNGSAVPMRLIVTMTLVPFLPRKTLKTPSLVIPNASFPSIFIIWSPDNRPTCSEGLSATGAITVKFPLRISNSIPIP